mgnify:FL=1|jgi:hypothetical protein
MPNHVISRIVIFGEKESIAAFVAAAKKDGEWDINALYPNPLAGFSSPVRIVPREEYDKQPEDIPLIGRAMTQEMHDRFVKQYGTADWYDWALRHWGTKWGVYDIEEESVTDTEVILTYSTAWSPATGLWAKVSELFPTLTFESEFVDECGNYCGRESYAAGEVTESEEYDVDSAEGKAICESVGYTFDFDEEEVEVVQ